MGDKIRALMTGHSDFSLEWDSSFKGSIAAPSTLSGGINLKYSSVPHFLYALAKPLRSFDFLDEKVRNEILQCERVGFAGAGYREIAECVQDDAKFYGSILTGEFSDRDGSKKKIEFVRLTALRDGNGISSLIAFSRENKIAVKRFEYLGKVPESLEYPYPIHVLLSPENETYVFQFRRGMNALKVGEKETKDIVKDICRLYGVVVAGALRSLLENKK